MKPFGAAGAGVGRWCGFAVLAALVWSRAGVSLPAADEGQVVGKATSPTGTRQ